MPPHISRNHRQPPSEIREVYAGLVLGLHVALEDGKKLVGVGLGSGFTFLGLGVVGLRCQAYGYGLSARTCPGCATLHAFNKPCYKAPTPVAK